MAAEGAFSLPLGRERGLRGRVAEQEKNKAPCSITEPNLPAPLVLPLR